MSSSLIEEACHDRLAGAGIIGQQKPQGLPRKHFTVDGRNLVRERFDLRSTDGEVRIEKVGKPDAIRLRSQAQKPTVGIESICPTTADEFEAYLLAAIYETLSDLTIGPKHEVDRVRTKSRNGYNFRDPVGIETFQSGSWLNFLECGHMLTSCRIGH